MMYLGEDEYDNIISFLSGFKNVRHDFIIKTGHKTRVVNLHYKGFVKEVSHALPSKTYDREESSTEPSLPVGYDLVEKALPGLDALLINMVSGVDITLETLKKIGENFTKYTHIDLHNIVMRTEADGRRVQVPVDNWDEWCSQCDSVQMNESELLAALDGKMKEYEAAEKILSGSDGQRTKALVVTRGKHGVSLFRKKERKVMNESYTEIDRTDIPAAERAGFKDSTGCGDVFASAFFYENAVSACSNYMKALKFANKFAGLKTEFTGVEELRNLHY
jgi:hypothetical protein